MMPPMALGGISGQRFKQGAGNFMGLLMTIAPTNLPDMTSLAVSGRLQNVIKYGTKVRKTGPVQAGQRVE